jgi:tRNA(adenine34) deaminase
MEDIMEEIIINRLKKLCNKALIENEVPIAAVIVQNNEIIGEGYNKVEQTQNFLNHAEIIAIKNAMSFKKNWRLDDCIMYVTLEPCTMCKEIIKKSRIKKVIYYSMQNEHQTECIPEYINFDNDYFSNILSNFFKNKR